MKQNNVVSLSGGKDSTAMLLMMLERKEPIHSVVFFDTEWEFPQMYKHIAKLEKNTGVKIIKIRSRIGFDYLMCDRPILERSKQYSDKQVRYIGFGWPTLTKRWCTTEKIHSLDYYIKPLKDTLYCIGLAADETKRSDKFKRAVRYPLQEYGMTERDCLQYCFEHGYDWGGLYKYYDRVSCYCCPLQRIKDLRTLKYNFPELWKIMLHKTDLIQRDVGRCFRGNMTLYDFDKQFQEEEKTLLLKRQK